MAQRSRSAWGSPDQGLGSELEGLKWPKRHVSVQCAVTMPLGTTMGCGPVRAARLSLRGAFRVGIVYSRGLLCYTVCCRTLSYV